MHQYLLLFLFRIFPLSVCVFFQMLAIKKIKGQGELKRKDPNSVKVSAKCSEKVKAVLDKSFEEEKG